MGEVINFPKKPDGPSEADVFHTLVYRLWMREWYPMFEEGGKLKHAYLVYGHLIDLMLELVDQGYIEITEQDDGYFLGMLDPVMGIIHENMIASYNEAKKDDEDDNEADKQLH